jgi:hypothetical protein
MSNQNIQVSLDGGITYQEAPNGVQVIYPNVDVPGEEKKGELRISLTSERVVKDLWVDFESRLDCNLASESMMVGAIIKELVEENV